MWGAEVNGEGEYQQLFREGSALKRKGWLGAGWEQQEQRGGQRTGFSDSRDASTYEGQERGSARRAKKAARRERVKFWSRWQKMELAEHKWGDWPETVKGAPPPL